MEKWTKFKEFYKKHSKKFLAVTVLIFFLFILGIKLFALPFSDGNPPGNHYYQHFENIFTPYTVIVPDFGNGSEFISSPNFAYYEADTSSVRDMHYTTEILLNANHSLESSSESVKNMVFADNSDPTYFESEVVYNNFSLDEYSVHYEDFFTSYAAFPFILSLVNPVGTDNCDVKVSLTAYYQTVVDDDYKTKSQYIEFDLNDTYLPDLSTTIMSWVKSSINDASVQSQQGVLVTDMIIYYYNISVLGPSSSILDFRADKFVTLDEDILDNGRGNEGSLTGYGMRLPYRLVTSTSGGLSGYATYNDVRYNAGQSTWFSSLQYYLNPDSYLDSYLLYDGVYKYRNSYSGWSDSDCRFIWFGPSTVINSDNVDALRNLIIYSGAEFGYYSGEGPATRLKFINRFEMLDTDVNSPNQMINSVATVTHITPVRDMLQFVMDTIDGVLEFQFGFFKVKEIITFVIGVALTVWFLKVVLGG